MTTLAQRLRADGAWLGASWLPRIGRDGYVFGVEAAHGDADPADPTVLLSAIGGKVEAGETFLGAALREYREETGTPPPVVAARARPILLGVDRPPAGDSEGGAVLIKTTPSKTVLPDPPALWIMVFTGPVLADPRPVEKLTGFAVLTPAGFAAVAGQRMLPAGVRVIGRPPATPAPVVLSETLAAVASRPDVLDLLLDGQGQEG